MTNYLQVSEIECLFFLVKNKMLSKLWMHLYIYFATQQILTTELTLNKLSKTNQKHNTLYNH